MKKKVLGDRSANKNALQMVNQTFEKHSQGRLSLERRLNKTKQLIKMDLLPQDKKILGRLSNVEADLHRLENSIKSNLTSLHSKDGKLSQKLAENHLDTNTKIQENSNRQYILS